MFKEARVPMGASQCLNIARGARRCAARTARVHLTAHADPISTSPDCQWNRDCTVRAVYDDDDFYYYCSYYYPLASLHYLSYNLPGNRACACAFSPVQLRTGCARGSCSSSSSSSSSSGRVVPALPCLVLAAPSPGRAWMPCHGRCCLGYPGPCSSSLLDPSPPPALALALVVAGFGRRLERSQPRASAGSICLRH
jgi:hypothetical protein